MSRILLLHPADAAIDLARLQTVTDSDTQIVARAVAYASCPPVSAHDWALADLAIMAAGQHAGDEGFDAVCIADFGDYGAAALRSLLSVPVVAAGRAAMLYALTLGSRFSILASPRDYVRAKKLVHEYGLNAQCADIISTVETDAPTPAFDSADVVVLTQGDENLRSLAARCNLPVIDPVQTALKMTESFLGLKLTHSRRAWPEPQTRKPELIDALVKS